MKLAGNRVLVTGGATGIGLSLAAGFLKAGSKVVICGRSASTLEAAREAYPGLQTILADISDADGREALVETALARFPDLNILVNNAAIQRRGDFLADGAGWPERSQEIAINLEAPIHLAALLAPHFLELDRAAIINVTSGLAFVPGSAVAVYAATKAALHAFTMALRARLAQTRLAVIELVPPAVDTALGGTGLHGGGIAADEFAHAVMARIAAGEVEIGHGTSEQFRLASRQERAEFFHQLNFGAPLTGDGSPPAEPCPPRPQQDAGMKALPDFVDIPAGWHLVDQRLVERAGDKARLLRWQPVCDRTLGIDQCSILISPEDDRLLSYRLLHECAPGALPEPEEASRLALAIFKATDPDHARGLYPLRVEHQSRHWRGLDGDMRDLPVAWAKFGHENGSYNWISFGPDGRVVEYEIQSHWDFYQDRRRTEQWDHDGWLAAREGTAPQLPPPDALA